MNLTKKRKFSGLTELYTLNDYSGFFAATPQPTYHLLVHNENASMWMRSFWNNQIDRLWIHSSDSHQIRGQTFWMFHLKTSNLEVIEEHMNIKTRPATISIHSIHFVFPFCPFQVGYIIIPISKNTWKIEATPFSDFSSFLPLKVVEGSDAYSTHPEVVLWDF